MRIAINGSPLAFEKTGVATYTEGLIRGLKSLKDCPEVVLLYEYRKSPGDATRVLPDFGFEVRELRWPERLRRGSRRMLNMPGVENLVGGPVDVYHNTGFYGMPQKHGAQVATIHDLVFDTFPMSFTPQMRKSLRTAVHDSVRRADIIITPSQASKNEVVRLLGVQGEKIRVIYEAAGEAFHPLDKDEARLSIKTGQGIDGPFVLYLGAGEPRKNLPYLVEAYARLDKRLRDEFKLVIAGPRRWGHKVITNIVGENNVAERVVFTGHVSDTDVINLYNAAEVFVFPSLAEGFGLPVLEAMACGTPVICSGTSSLPEVAGLAARLIDPYKNDTLVSALTDLLDDETVRLRMAAAGLEQAAGFSWQKTAQETLAVYREAANL